jgi:hypothetical protein
MQKMGPQFLRMGGEDNHESFSVLESAAPRLPRRIYAYIGGNLLFGALLISLVVLGVPANPPTFYLLLLFLLCGTLSCLPTGTAILNPSCVCAHVFHVLWFRGLGFLSSRFHQP